MASDAAGIWPDVLQGQGLKGQATVPIHPQLADALRAWRPITAGPTDFALGIVPNVLCLRADLKLAGIRDVDETDRYVDFHSLRLSLSTMLAAHKVSPRVAQALMRHFDPAPDRQHGREAAAAGGGTAGRAGGHAVTGANAGGMWPTCG